MMGFPDAQIAQIQIAALFASSELPLKDHGTGEFGSMRGISASALEQRRRVAAAAEEDGYASNATNPSIIGGYSQGRLNGKGRPMFKPRSCL